MNGVYKLVNDLLVGAQNYQELAVRLEELLKRCRKARMTLASNKVQVGEKRSFASYLIDGTTVCPDPRRLRP